MFDLDEEVDLLFGEAIRVDDFLVYPLTVDEIRELKFSYFYAILQILIADESDLEHVPENLVVYPFDIFLSNIVYCQDELFKNKIFDFLKKSLRQEYVIVQDDCIYVGDNITLNIANYDLFVETIKKQYSIKKEAKKPRTEKQKEYDREVAEKRRKYAKWLAEDSEDITDLISSVCAIHPSINIDNIGKYTVYYLMNQFKRLNKRDDYFISIKRLLAGDTSNEVKVVHWVKKIVS